VKANLRLVVSIAKEVPGRGWKLLDLGSWKGSPGPGAAVGKIDPTRGYKFSTYAFLVESAESMTRDRPCHSRTIRLPVHLGERLRPCAG